MDSAASTMLTLALEWSIPFEFLSNDGFSSDQDHLELKLAGGAHGPGNSDHRAEVSSHGINGDLHDGFS